jgi:hypothetical protein
MLAGVYQSITIVYELLQDRYSIFSNRHVDMLLIEWT